MGGRVWNQDGGGEVRLGLFGGQSVELNVSSSRKCLGEERLSLQFNAVLVHRSVQLSGHDSVCIRGEAPSFVQSDRQLQRGELRLSGV